MTGAGGCERVTRCRQIVRAFELERSEVRVPAHQDHFHDRVVEGRVRLLRDDCDAPRQFPPGKHTERTSAEQDGPPVRGDHPGKQVEQRGLAAAVGAEQAGERPHGEPTG